jgi:hypothetical protein
MTHGQGKPLPALMKLSGEWIIENVVFLYHSDYSISSPSATFPVRAEREDGSYALGFDAAQLAGAFEIDVSALIDANRNHTLVFVGDIDVVPTHGGVSAVAYIFRIGDRQASVVTDLGKSPDIRVLSARSGTNASSRPERSSPQSP